MPDNNNQVFPVTGRRVLRRRFNADNQGFDIVQNTSQFSLTFATGTIFNGIEAIDGNGQDIYVAKNSTVDFSSIREMRNVRYLRGSNGNETIIGSKDDDTFFSSIGRDRYEGKGGNDVFLINPRHSKDDQFNGGGGYDVLRNTTSKPLSFKNASFTRIEEIDGNNQAIRIERNGQADFSSVKKMTDVAFLIGRNKSQTIVGSQDKDIFYSTPGEDILDGQGKNDTFLLAKDEAASDTIYGGPGYDAIKNRSNQPLVFRNPDIQGIEEIDANGKTILIDNNGIVNFSSVRKMKNVRNIKGSNGNEIIIGSQDRDVLQGRNGNDVLEGNEGDDTVDGGLGEDIAVFSGRRRDYKIKQLSNDTFTVKDLRDNSPHGIDTLFNIEFIEFFDDKLDLSLPLDANDDLVAIDDTVTIDANGSVSISNGSGAKGANNGTSNVLGNDIAANGVKSIYSVNGSSSNVGQSIQGSRGGLFNLNANGTLSFTENGDFNALPAGRSVTTDITYDIKDSNQQFTQQKSNIVFVIDVSGSTSAGFQGTPVGNPNRDRRSNTILDAEIAAFQALDDKIASLNLPPSQVNIGLVSFSSFGQTIGTYDPGTASLDSALSRLRYGGLTNFESPLQQTENWFAQQGATRNDNNVVYFLSDGFPNRGGSWRDEVRSMENNYDTSFVAVGVGRGASLSQLASIDNTGGAEIVTSSDALKASLLDSITIDDFKVSNTATVSVTIEGESGSPVANDDVATTKKNVGLDIDVLRNDSGINVGDVISIANVGGATNGVTEVVDGKVRYTPNSGFIGDELLTYTIRNSTGKTDSANINVSVRRTNTAPTGTDDFGSTFQDTPITVNVLANDRDIDGDTLALASTLEKLPSNGTARVVNNRIQYTPSAGYVGEDSLEYQVLDGNGGTDIATLDLEVKPRGNVVFL